MSGIEPNDLVRIQSKCGGFFHVGEAVSYPCPIDGRTNVRIIPGQAWSARMIDTKRLSRPEIEVWDEHLEDWA